VPDQQSCASFSALGTSALVCVDAAERDRLSVAREAVEEVIAEFDRSCSRFREDSGLCALNRAAGSPVEVERLLLDAVQAALRAAILTDGDVDPTVGEALVALGYDRDFEALAGDEGLRRRPVSIASVPGWRAVQLDIDAATIRVPRGVRLDLGATAKALAADRAAEAALHRAGCGVLVGLGGDFAAAGTAPGRGWRIRVTDDHRAGTDVPGQWITIRAGGLATSSTTVRRWTTASGTAHHVIDPATGRPVSAVWRTASVAAGSCLDANIASTATIVRGERAVDWLAELALPSRLVRVDGTVVHVAGWPAEGDDLLLASREPVGERA
jgi:thiamine biosynthesis lipoprotein